MVMISPTQMRMARAGLGWGVRELAERAGLQPGTISRIENGKEAMGGSLRKIEQAFEDAGVDFPDEDTVSLKRLRNKAT
jgi:transcriptional regulator with XRE-family HTH domain